MGYKIGLLAAAAVFIGFALASSFLFPRRRPDFPGQRLGLFIAASFLLFLGMLVAVEAFGREEDQQKAAEGRGGHVETDAATTQPTTAPGPVTRTIEVVGREFTYELATTRLRPGTYKFDFVNEGGAPHNLVIKGPEVDNVQTPVIAGGKRATIEVALVSGTYEFYCSVPGHEEAGMKIEVEVS